ncbi:MAG TPA: XrtB/PEP-CTERM-associated polysaccharide biosynthesis outer membrane protein EpsL [Burkholderiaceae bacterium]|nr:XrtB/PEP-CTERM-associated polysaccharide biosynthesis outer membrane protein EpsL [Burkholderiaceae bacterium]
MPSSSPLSRKRSPLVVAPLAALIGAALSGQAQAALSDTIHPFVSVLYSYEDNLLRLPDGVPGPSGSRSDSLTQLQAGLLFERPIGRQRFTGQAKVSRVTFDHYDQLNYNGKDFQAEWEWYLARDFSGHIGASYGQVLTPFTDYHSGDRNLRTTRREYADGNWRFHPSWQVHAGVSTTRYSYDLASQRYIDRTEDSSELGVDYLASSGSRFGVLGRHLRGSYPNKPVLSDGTVLDYGYKQDELKANIFWVASGVTQVQVLAGWARREHSFFTDHNSSGLNGRITAYWLPLGKLKFNASVWRDYAAVESTLVSSSLNKGVSVGAGWDISAKLKADATVRHEKRDFSTVSPVVLLGSPTDTGNFASVGLTYTPLNYVQLNTSVFRDQRTGSAYIGTGSYTAKGISFGATGQF